MTGCGVVACVCLICFLCQALIPRELEYLNRPVEVTVGLTLLLSGVVFLPTAIIYGFRNGLASLNWFHRIVFLGFAFYVGRLLLSLFATVLA